MKLSLTPMLLCLLFHLAVFGQGDTLYQTTKHDGIDRSYILYVPEAYDGSEAWPLVLNLHGYALNAEFQMNFSNMNAVADTAHFLVAYPQGTTFFSQVPGIPPQGLGWNISGPSDTVFVSPGQVDDVDFLEQVIDHIGADFRVAPERVYSTGFSNGGMMSYVLACELPDRIAAIAPVAGTIPESRLCAGDQVNPKPVLHIHGTADGVVPYEDGDPFLHSVGEILQFWTTGNGCDEQPQITAIADVTTADSTTVERYEWQNCEAEMLHYRVIGGGHQWPGGNNLLPFLGHFNLDFNASSEIWNFFNRNPHPEPAESQVIEQSFVHNDSLRSYLLYVPAAYDGSEDWPLVINYHGFTNSAGDQMFISQMNPVADTARFLVAYPQGLHVNNPFLGFSAPGWNVDGTLSENDDLDFTSQLIDQISAGYAVAPARVYATGWSMGASIAFQAVCALPGRIASVAGVANQMADSQIENCSPGRPVSALLMQGTADPITPFDGDGVLFSSAYNTPSFWAGQNNCSSDSLVIDLDDVVTTDTSTVTLIEYTDCDADTEVLFYRINDGGHAWPGGGALPAFLGKVNRDINASSEIWNFFNRNPHPDPAESQVIEQSFVHNDSLRSYLLYVPAAYDGSEDWPLVINFHQFGWSPGDYMAHIGMNTVADTGRFLIAYPQGLTVQNPVSMQQGPGWNESEGLSVNDDVGFTETLISQVSASYQVDPARVYATGWGMGAGFAQKAQCELADLIAATASVCGPLTDLLLQTCTPDRPLSMLFMQGTADPFIPFDPDPQHPITTMGISGSVAFLRANNNCTADSTITEITDSNTEDGSTVTLIEYDQCDAGTEIVVYRVNGGGHAWPGGGALPEFFGAVNRDINASSEIWNFFNRNPRPDVPSRLSNLSSKRFRIYPNPSYGEITVEFDLASPQTVQLRMFNMLGQPATGAIRRELPAGSQRINWNWSDGRMSAGIYYLQIQMDRKQLTQPVVLKP